MTSSNPVLNAVCDDSDVNHTRELAAFLARLSYTDLPDAVLARTEDLFLDWLGSALASQGAHPIPLFERYAAKMGPASGPATILVSGQRSSAYFAALINAASSHLVEQDDLHNSSVLHPATVVFPAVLAAPRTWARAARRYCLRLSPAMKQASESVSFWGARTIASSIPRRRSAPSPLPWPSAN
jgi:2-methylcitrate dehydratase PrpD